MKKFTPLKPLIKTFIYPKPRKVICLSHRNIHNYNLIDSKCAMDSHFEFDREEMGGKGIYPENHNPLN